MHQPKDIDWVDENVQVCTFTYHTTLLDPPRVNMYNN